MTQRCLDSSQSCPAPERQRVADLSRPGFKKTLVAQNSSSMKRRENFFLNSLAENRFAK